MTCNPGLRPGIATGLVMGLVLSVLFLNIYNIRKKYNIRKNIILENIYNTIPCSNNGEPMVKCDSQTMI
jgi:hypothetical protein